MPDEKVENKAAGKRSFAGRLLRVFAWIVGLVVAVILLAMCGVAWILTPERLTSIVGAQANQLLNADVGLARVELTVWRTFPHLILDVDSLVIRSRAFDGLPEAERAKMPADADTLLVIGRFHGSLNVPALLAGNISLSDIHLGASKINAVVYDSETANFDITYPSVDSVETSTGTLLVPDIRIDRFEIQDSLPVRYYSVPDSMNLALTVRKSPLLTGNDSGYHVDLNAGMDMLLPPELRYKSLDMSINGNVKWSYERPEIVELSDFELGVGALKPKFDLALNLSEPMTLSRFGVALGGVSPDDLLSVVPDTYRGKIGDIDTDMRIDMEVTLLSPYVVGVDSGLPSMDVRLAVPRCRLLYDRKYELKSFAFEGNMNIPDGDINKAVLEVGRLQASAVGAVVDLKGRFTNLTSDPYIDAMVNADVDFSKVPAALKAELPGELTGSVDFDSKVKMRLSDMNVGRFHRILLDGKLGLRDVNYAVPDSGMRVYLRDVEFKLGTNTSFVTDARRIDSLLTASVKIDSASLVYEGMKVRLSNANIGAGCLNKPRGADSTVVMPFGAVLKIGALNYEDADSSMVRLRDVAWNAMLRRYEGQKDVPMLQLFGDIRRAFFTDRSNYLMLQKGHVDVTAHLRKRRTVSQRIKARYDSILMSNPGISQDSAVSILRTRYASRSRTDSVAYERISLDLGDDAKKLLRRWNVAGHLSAERGGAFTPHFPIRNRISHFDISFSTDSVVLNDIRYDAGRSDFTINGAVRGITRAITRDAPLNIDFRVKCDSLNVNELVQAAYVGAAYAGKAGVSGGVTDVPMDDAELDRLADAANSSDTIGALLVPMNLRADIRIDADNIVYSDMRMRDFNGRLMVNDGVMTLRNLSARSDIGSARMTALYMAPTKSDIHFGMGLQLDGIKIKEFIGMMPAVDSLMPLLNSFEGIISADVVATSDIDSTMNIVMPTLDAAVKLNGSNLVLLDAETFRTMAKWLMFKDNKISGNKIDDMSVELLIRNSTVELFPFVFDFDRYRLAVMGSNDLSLNYKYHVSVLKSPLPFKFGINISGNADDMKIRLGGAKYKPGKAGERLAIVDTTRVNLMKEIDRVFQRGARAARLGPLKVAPVSPSMDADTPGDTISSQDSLLFIKEGLIEAPLDSVPAITNVKEK